MVWAPPSTRSRRCQRRVRQPLVDRVVVQLDDGLPGRSNAVAVIAAACLLGASLFCGCAAAVPWPLPCSANLATVRSATLRSCDEPSVGPGSRVRRSRGLCEHRSVRVRLLLVEDDDRVRAVLASRWRTRATTWPRPPAPRRPWPASPPSPRTSMLVDLMLGGMSGFDCIREMRRTTTSRSWWSAPATTPTTSSPAWRPAPTTTSPSRSRSRRSPLGCARCCAGRSAVATTSEDVGALVLDGFDARPRWCSTAAGWVRRGGEPVHLTLTEFRLLCELAEAVGRVLAASSCWNGLGPRVLRRRAAGRRPRAAAADEDRGRPGRPRAAVTVRGLGYRLDRR